MLRVDTSSELLPRLYGQDTRLCYRYSETIETMRNARGNTVVCDVFTAAESTLVGLIGSGI